MLSLLARDATGQVTAPDSAAPADTSGPPLTISGFVTASYTYSTQNTRDAVAGRFYDRFHDQVMLNAAKVVLERPVRTDRFDAGVRADFLFGQDAKVTQSLGLDLGDNGDLTQAFVTLNIPAGVGRYVQFKAGKLATLMGIEVIEDVVNPNLSVANQFVYLENFTNTGLRVDVKPSAAIDFELAVFNGWDVVRDNNTQKSFMGRIGITPTGRTVIGLLGYYGAEQANGTSKRSGGEIVVTQKLGPKATVYLQGDYGEEQDLPSPGSKARWWGLGAWGTYDVTPVLGIAVRGDYINDEDGTRTSGVFGFPPNAGQKFGSGTVTLNIKRWQHVLVRPELRYDRSSLAVFGDPATPSKDQVTFALGTSYMF
ncbi:MAG TPA: outer membrane beta-barrel protein [Gemmatimonadales bacterium]|nr:outer membrane beta-barrel protein [Gemmatimonadales bacterium]